MLNTDLYKELCKMKENYKQSPLDDIKLSRPIWLDENDPMSEIYDRKADLLQNGEIVYAHIVQANTLLFKRFPPIDCPAQIVYSTVSYFMEHTESLQEIAWRLYAYKGQNLNEVPDEWKEVARVITDEYDRSDFTFELETEDCMIPLHMIPTMVYRKLLPKGKLCGSLIPVLTLPDCKQVLILPHTYWTNEFKKAWIEGTI